MREGKREQTDLIYGGLIGVCVLVVQIFLAQGNLDPLALVSVVSFAVAIPLLAILLVLNHMERRYERVAMTWYMILGIVVALGAAIVGLAAAFWRVSWIAGVVFIFSGAVAMIFYGVYYNRLERDNPKLKDAQADGSSADSDPA